MPVAIRPRGRPQLAQNGSIPAPVGGVNTVAGGSAMPEGDAVWIYNMIASTHGLQSRMGYREWVTGLTGALDSAVGSMLAFTGSAKNGTQDKLFAVTSTGIWDVSASTTTPTQLVTFSYTGQNAGVGTSTTFSTPAGRFLVYCDEENGLYLWSETAAAWSQVLEGTTQAWTAQTLYFVDNEVVSDGGVYVCVTEGTSDASSGPTGTGTGITDGTAVWDYVSASSATAIGANIDAQNDDVACDPADFVAVVAFKNRLWFVERDTSRAWYLDANAVYGSATYFDFGGQLRAGGPLRALFNWSYDGGSGIDTLLVGISGAGDVVIYQGTDPDSASTFGLKGCWSVGAVPAGRRIATDYGGDLLVLSLVGVVPLSKLVVGADEAAAGIYATAKIANLFSQLASERKDLPGWGVLIHPQDNALLVTVPTTPGAATEQLAMAFATKGWSRYRDFPVFSACVLQGEVYFGTIDGRVCRNIGYIDDVKLADSNDYDAIQWSVLTAYRNLGNDRQKQVKMLRPVLLGDSASPVVSAQALYDWSLLEPSVPTGSPTDGWDSGVWDTAVWGGDFTAFGLMLGAVGMGRDVAVAVRGAATGRTVLVSVGVTFEVGGLL